MESLRIRDGLTEPCVLTYTICTAKGDFVTIHLTHHVTFHPGARLRTRGGPVDAGDKSVEWQAMVIVRLEGDKIAEEWVVGDELQVLLQFGAVKPLGDTARVGQ